MDPETKNYLENDEANPMDVPRPMPDSAPLVLAPVDIEHTDILYPDWLTRGHARHNVRAICDLVGLSSKKTILIKGNYYSQKDVLAACVDNESGFLLNPKPNVNKDPRTGEVWSTDWGIVQINDHFWIGPGKRFPSVQYVIDHPEECVRWMAEYYKLNGHLDRWSSYKTRAFEHYLA